MTKTTKITRRYTRSRTGAQWIQEENRLNPNRPAKGVAGLSIAEDDEDDVEGGADMAVPARKLETRLGPLVSVRIEPRF
jgi:hypothetical protein